MRDTRYQGLAWLFGCYLNEEVTGDLAEDLAEWVSEGRYRRDEILNDLDQALMQSPAELDVTMNEVQFGYRPIPGTSWRQELMAIREIIERG